MQNWKRIEMDASILQKIKDRTASLKKDVLSREEVSGVSEMLSDPAAVLGIENKNIIRQDRDSYQPNEISEEECYERVYNDPDAWSK